MRVDLAPDVSRWARCLKNTKLDNYVRVASVQLAACTSEPAPRGHGCPGGIAEGGHAPRGRRRAAETGQRAVLARGGSAPVVVAALVVGHEVVAVGWLPGCFRCILRDETKRNCVWWVLSAHQWGIGCRMPGMSSGLGHGRGAGGKRPVDMREGDMRGGED